MKMMMMSSHHYQQRIQPTIHHYCQVVEVKEREENKRRIIQECKCLHTFLNQVSCFMHAYCTKVVMLFLHFCLYKMCFHVIHEYIFIWIITIQKKNTVVDIQVIDLVFLSCFLQAINTLDDLPSTVHRGIDAVDTVCVYIFAVEFILRWWSAGRFQLRYLAKPLASIDAVSLCCVLFL